MMANGKEEEEVEVVLHHQHVKAFFFLYPIREGGRHVRMNKGGVDLPPYLYLCVNGK